MEKEFEHDGCKASKAGYYILDYDDLRTDLGDLYKGIDKLKGVKIEPSLANIDEYGLLYSRLKYLAKIASHLFVYLQTATNQTQDMFEFAKSIIEQEECKFTDDLVGIVSQSDLYKSEDLEAKYEQN